MALKINKKTKKNRKPKSKDSGDSIFRGISSELQKTEWLSKKPLAKLSFTVFMTAVLLGLVLYSLDIGFQRLLGAFI